MLQSEGGKKSQGNYDFIYFFPGLLLLKVSTVIYLLNKFHGLSAFKNPFKSPLSNFKYANVSKEK